VTASEHDRQPLERIDWDKGDGLVPAIVQDVLTGKVLMLGYMNRAAFAATLERGRLVFFSRSKQRLWEKGESSGHHLELVQWHADCDADALLFIARPAGPVCHTGAVSCFGNDAVTHAERLGFLSELEQLIAQRRADRPDGSYTARLLAQGPRRIAQKIGEEGVEVALAAVVESDEALLAECSDLIYHLLVLLQGRRLGLEAVVAELQRRHRDGKASAEHKGPEGSDD
jgi:phosphoribosyl-AMP cyclohydrolase / phosphoribosyl-ATP pyrophosphohydrolase